MRWYHRHGGGHHRHLVSVLGPEMDSAPRLAMGVLGGEHARGETCAMQTAEGVLAASPEGTPVVPGYSRPFGLPPGWTWVTTRYGNQGRTYTRFSSQDGRHRHLRSVRAVVRQVARDNGEDPEAAVAKVCLESEVMGNLDILLNWCLFSRTVSLLGWKP